MGRDDARRKTICKSFGASQSKSESTLRRRAFRACLTTQSKFWRLASRSIPKYIYRRLGRENPCCCDGMKEAAERKGDMISRRAVCRSWDGPPPPVSFACSDSANFDDGSVFLILLAQREFVSSYKNRISRKTRTFVYLRIRNGGSLGSTLFASVFERKWFQSARQKSHAPAKEKEKQYKELKVYVFVISIVAYIFAIPFWNVINCEGKISNLHYFYNV